MEDRHIFWGELVGGLLMVGCSIALVIYLWKDLARIPYSQFLIFVSTTAIVFGAGLYALHRLKLATTSRGLLLIATLLVPLNFLVMAGLASQEPDVSIGQTSFRIGTEIVSLALFAWLISLSAEALWLPGRLALVVGVLGASASQLAVRFLSREESSTAQFLLMGSLPVLSQVVPLAGTIYWLQSQKSLEARNARGFLIFLGILSYALVVALGFLTYWSADREQALQRLAVLIAVGGVPILAGGVLVHRGLATPADAAAEACENSSGIRAAGTATALVGILAMLSAVVLAWPQPLSLIIICGLNFAVLTAVAFRHDLRLAHAPALASLAVGYLIAIHWSVGHLAQEETAPGLFLLRTMLSSASGLYLIPLVILLWVSAELFVRRQQREDGVVYAAASAAIAALSLALVTLAGLDQPGRAALVTGFYAAGSLVMNLRWRRVLVSYAGLGLVVVSSLWTLWWHADQVTPIWGLVTACEALAFVVVAHWFARLPIQAVAWRNMAIVAGLASLALVAATSTQPVSLVPPTTGLVLAATALILAADFGAAAWTFAGSALLLASLLYAFYHQQIGVELEHPIPLAFLSHATLVLLVALILHWGPWSEREPIGTLYTLPLARSGLIASIFALPLLVLVWGDWQPLAGYAAWLSGLWLGIAWVERRPGVFLAFRAALAATVLLETTAILERYGPSLDLTPARIQGPAGLQAYGIGLGLLALAWMVVRLTIKKQQPLQLLLQSPWVVADWVILFVLVLGQGTLALSGVWPVVLKELLPVEGSTHWSLWGAVEADAWGMGAWLLLVLLAAVLVLGLWHRFRPVLALGLVVLFLTVPFLLAGPFADANAAAVALRWGLAGGFVLGSIPFWGRDALGRSLPARPDLEPLNAERPRRWLLAGTVAPLVLLTAVVAAVQFSGEPLALPVAGSWFDRLGWPAANWFPLALCATGLVGHALREHRAGYAFAAGQLALAATISGYAFDRMSAGVTFGTSEWVVLLQLGTLAAGLWGLVWLLSRRWVDAWREGSANRWAQPLMAAQLLEAGAGNLFLLVVACGLLVTRFPESSAWAMAEGSFLGWLTLSAAIAAALLRFLETPARPRPLLLPVVLTGLVAWVACLTARTWPGYEYRTLMLGWAGLAALLVPSAWLTELRHESTAASPTLAALLRLLMPALVPEGLAPWVRLLTGLVVALGLKAAIFHPDDHLWAAAAIALAGASGALMAVWRRREAWAFQAGLCCNLAASLAVWHFHAQDPVELWWVRLLQANILASAGVACLWLAGRRFLYASGEWSLRSGPFLAAQVGLGLVGNLLLLVPPAVRLFLSPGEPLPLKLAETGSLWGWLAWGTATAALFWYSDQGLRRGRSSALAAGLLGFALLAACRISVQDKDELWLAYHVWTAAWAGIGLLLIGAPALARLRGGELDQVASFPTLARWLRIAPTPLRLWVTVIGLLVVALAIRGTVADPGRPYWSAGAVMAASCMAGPLAIQQQRPAYVSVAGLLINLVGTMIWVAVYPYSAPLEDPALAALLYVQALCLGLAAGIWFGLEKILRVSTHSGLPAAGLVYPRRNRSLNSEAQLPRA